MVEPPQNFPFLSANIFTNILICLQAAFYNLGVVFSELTQFETALGFYERAATLRPLYAEAHCNMGVIYKNCGDLQAAITCYETWVTQGKAETRGLGGFRVQFRVQDSGFRIQDLGFRNLYEGVCLEVQVSLCCSQFRNCEKQHGHCSH